MTELSADDVRANPTPAASISHDFDCTHNPCRCTTHPAEIVLLARKPHPFEERILFPGVEGSYCFYCDETEDGNPLHADGQGA